MKLFHTIRGRLFISCVSILLLAVAAMSVAFYRYTAESIETRASDSLSQLAVNTNGNLDALIRGMDSIANRIVSSELIKDTFYRVTDGTAEEIKHRQDIINLLFTVTGSRIENQISLFTTQGRLVDFGRRFDVSAMSPNEVAVVPWLETCLEREGKMYIAAPHPYTWGSSDDLVFSVCRAFNRSFGAAYDAVVEVRLDYSALVQAVDSTVRPERVRAYVYDSDGHLIHPLDENAPVSDYFSQIPGTEPSGTFPMGEGAEREIAAYYRSSYSGITMVVCENEKELLAPVTQFRNWLLLVGLVVALLVGFVTYLLAKQLTEPIRGIQNSISKLQLTNLHPQSMPRYENSADELTQLGHAYLDMVARLQLSLEETVAARSHETEARMRALQAQMNPHFLYNTITVISIKAEDNDDPEVVGMCECLTGMLRYVTRSSDPQVTLGQELSYLEQYLYLMRCRYPDRFTVELHVPEEMRGLSVPKLVLQPLVENSFRHGFGSAEHWSLSLTGQVSDGKWEINISDNGVGFSPETLSELERRFAAARGDFSVAPCDHIGLANIFERLRFRYHENAVFHIENLPDGGCRVTIGGLWSEEGLL